MRAKCPNCDVTMVYVDDDVEQLKCWNCYRHLDFDEDDELFLSEDYLPRNMVTETRSEVL